MTIAWAEVLSDRSIVTTNGDGRNKGPIDHSGPGFRPEMRRLGLSRPTMRQGLFNAASADSDILITIDYFSVIRQEDDTACINNQYIQEIHKILNTASNVDKALAEWLGHEIWGLSLAVTLNLKQGRVVFDDRGRSFYIPLTEDLISQNVNHFCNLLNSAVYGNNWRRRKQRVPVLTTREKASRHHVHLRIAAPRPPAKTIAGMKTASDQTQNLLRAVYDCWRKTDWGYGSTRVSLSDDGWTDYITKTGSSSVIWVCTHLPTEASRTQIPSQT